VRYVLRQKKHLHIENICHDYVARFAVNYMLTLKKQLNVEHVLHSTFFVQYLPRKWQADLTVVIGRRGHVDGYHNCLVGNVR
jgi:hypothetical protein